MMDKIKALLTPKILATIFLLISGGLGYEVSTNYTIEPIPAEIKVTLPDPKPIEDKIAEICNKISAKGDNDHLEEYHGGH